MAGCGSPRTQPGRAVLRRASGEFDEVNSPIKDKSGEPILVPNGVDLKTGEPQPNTPLQDAIPDAANYEKGLIIDDKPDGRPIRKDRHEIIRFLEAFKQREGVYPETSKFTVTTQMLVNLLA